MPRRGSFRFRLGFPASGGIGADGGVVGWAGIATRSGVKSLGTGCEIGVSEGSPSVSLSSA